MAKQKVRKRRAALETKRSSTANTATAGARSQWIRTKKQLEIPTEVREIIRRLSEKGYVAYVVGGSVRDFLLDRPSKDHDIATNATPDQVAEIFDHCIMVGKEFGVVRVPIGDGSQQVEVSTFRIDLEYKDHRHPTAVEFSNETEDAKRRDFTINGLYYDLKSGKILDSVDGYADIDRKVIRAIGDPEHRFKEDALRLLRAIRFTTHLNFTLEAKTAEAIQKNAALIQYVSGERIRDELTLMLTGPAPALAIQYLSSLGILKHILPELEKLRGLPQPTVLLPDADVWNHTLRILELLARYYPEPSADLAWTALLIDVGKPAAYLKSGKKNFNGHETEATYVVRKIANRYKLPNEKFKRIKSTLENQLKLKTLFQMREATQIRFVREPYFENLLKLHHLDARATDGNLANYDFGLSRLQEVQKTPIIQVRLLDGDDLIQLGLEPGKEFSDILRIIEDLALERKLKTKDEALEYVIKHFVQ